MRSFFKGVTSKNLINRIGIRAVSTAPSSNVPVRLSTKITLGALLLLSKSVYDGTFCYYNNRIIHEAKVGEKFWQNIGKDYISRSSEKANLSGTAFDLEYDSPVAASITADWSGPVYTMRPEPKVRLFRFEPHGTFEKALDNNTTVKFEADLHDGRWIVSNITLEKGTKTTTLPLVDQPRANLFNR